jgi:peptidyl-tRNA hydrolase, PTH1 family
MIRMIVGLGNPGTEYEGTRHNAGFWWVDAAARQLKVALRPDRAYHGLLARVSRPCEPLWLLEPLTYMNLSGKAVAPLARFYKITPAEILVVHDELDIAPGQMKLKLGGSAAGHNGLKDIQAQLGSLDFWRLRLGIGHPGVRTEVIHYVLRRPPADEREAIERCIDESLKALDLLQAGDMERAMMKLHAKPARPKPPRPSVADQAADQPADAAPGTPAGDPTLKTAPE